MRLRTLALLIASITTSSTLAAQAAPPCGGRWTGSIVLPDGKLDFELNFKLTAPGTCTGTISIPSQGASDVPLESVMMRADSASFVISQVPGEPTFKGARSADGQSMKGTFTQGPNSLDFSATMAAPPASPPNDDAVRTRAAARSR
jgi:uncharacterized protein